MRLRQNISSACLFHFVKRLEFLTDIIQNGFQARYVAEIFPLLNHPFIVPMKCFCDVPLGMIKNHINRYGKYGIGVTKEFAMSHQITPCIYTYDNSKALYTYLTNAIVTDMVTENIIQSLVPYIKKYEDLEVVNHKEILIRFYDEREWRYVPNNVDIAKHYELSLEEAADIAENKNNNLSKNQYRLVVSPSEIKYIFVKNDYDVKLVIREIHKIDFSKEMKDFLISRIITSDQIMNDF